MFSETFKAALEREIVGQSAAVNGVVRGVTRVVSGLTPRERTLCAYLFVGPTGTGKTHLVRTLARLLHGDEQRTVVIDCAQFLEGDPGHGFIAQLGSLFGAQQGELATVGPASVSILRIEALERAPKELFRTLGAIIETGEVVLPGGNHRNLGNCLIFITTSLCSREILADAPTVGFSGGPDAEDDEGQQDRTYRTCHEMAEQQFGSELVGSLDALCIFHPLENEHLAGITDRRIERLNAWLARRGACCEVHPAAKQFLLTKGRRDLRTGARELIGAHRRLLEFPVADLLISGRVPPGGVVDVDRRPDEDHCHFTVRASEAERPCAGAAVYEVPILDQPGSKLDPATPHPR